MRVFFIQAYCEARFSVGIQAGIRMTPLRSQSNRPHAKLMYCTIFNISECQTQISTFLIESVLIIVLQLLRRGMDLFEFKVDN